MAEVAITCDNKALVDIFTLLNSCFGKDSDGKLYLRYEPYSQDAGESDAVTCANNQLTPEEQFFQLLRQCVVKNSEDKNAIRLGSI